MRIHFLTLHIHHFTMTSHRRAMRIHLRASPSQGSTLTPNLNAMNIHRPATTAHRRALRIFGLTSDAEQLTEGCKLDTEHFIPATFGSKPITAHSIPLTFGIELFTARLIPHAYDSKPFTDDFIPVTYGGKSLTQRFIRHTYGNNPFTQYTGPLARRVHSRTLRIPLRTVCVNRTAFAAIAMRHDTLLMSQSLSTSCGARLRAKNTKPNREIRRPVPPMLSDTWRPLPWISSSSSWQEHFGLGKPITETTIENERDYYGQAA